MAFFKRWQRRIEIEEAIRRRLKGDAQKNALDLVAFMRANGFSFDWHNFRGDIGWGSSYKGKGFGVVKVADGDKYLWLCMGHECYIDDSAPVDDGLKEFVWAHVRVCPQPQCKPPYCTENSEHPASKNRRQFFGKE